ncbi:MAG: CCA tRNA nucleotidyltransferase [Lachnospiraceae bacterium]|nr:CCA tRNA nucleotidyltransferase [Lachnospiraceae bacterium]
MEYRIDTPKNVNFIIKLLEREGYEAFAVGGCVRDALMGNEPQDWDITTSAAPLDVKKIFHKTIDTGLQHGTVTVMLEHVGYEVTTYRIDGTYSDGRHPDEVKFTKNLVEDLKRRDFTINAMAYNPKTGIVDEFDGVGDLERKLIKCVGNPKERFTEDALRMLRAVRFAAKLGFAIEENTAKAITDMAENISKVSKERIHSELDKLVTSNNPHILKYVYTLGLDKFIIPNATLKNEEQYDNVINVMKCMKPDHYLRWAAFMMYEGENAKSVLKTLKFDNKTLNICDKLVNSIDYFKDYDQIEEKKYHIKKLIVSIGEEIFADYYLAFMEAIIKAKMSDLNENILNDIRNLYQQIKNDGDCISKENMVLKGNELKALGVEPGKVMGEVINKMFDEILKDPSMNDRDKLIDYLKLSS